MRYCPHCRRINPGRPQFCHFCARTWHVRICQRGHENPSHVQFCGTCGSADLTETAGPRSWVMILFNASLWILVSLFIYGLVSRLAGLFKPSVMSHVLPPIIAICLFFFVLRLVMTMLPGSIGNSIKRFFGMLRKLLVKAVVWFLGKLWEILR